MQIVRPDMLPMIAGILILLLSIILIVGLLTLYFGFKSLQEKKSKPLAIGLISVGLVIIGFVIYNWFGYNRIFNERENMLVGEFISESFETRMYINNDKTWALTRAENVSVTGSWEYVMSEDWCYWNIESNDMEYRTQTGSMTTIFFKEQNLKFNKITNHNGEKIPAINSK